MRLLVADDDNVLRDVIMTELKEDGAEATGAHNGLEALVELEKGEFDVLLLDMNMPGLHGIEVLKKVNSLSIPTEVVVLTGNATVPTAVEAMKLGAYDYLMKPFEFDNLKKVIKKAYEKKSLKNENFLLKNQLRRQSACGSIVTESPLVRELLKSLGKIALSDLPVLVYGESGSGKELVARAIHEASLQADGPFIPINCGAIPENIMESELFGYEKGAFTSAITRKPGLLELADKGTLFLDEIGEMPLSLQVKLLRVIETGAFYRVGGTREIKVSTRIVSATNKDLRAEVDGGGFRADLFYRISSLMLTVPPLRERTEDIEPLISHFISNSGAHKNRRFSPEAVKALKGYYWPGNIRELQNIVHRALLLAHDNVITTDDLPQDIANGQQNAHTSSTLLADIERVHIKKVLDLAGGKKSDAARMLGIDPKTLYRKLAAIDKKNPKPVEKNAPSTGKIHR